MAYKSGKLQPIYIRSKPATVFLSMAVTLRSLGCVYGWLTACRVFSWEEMWLDWWLSFLCLWGWLKGKEAWSQGMSSGSGRGGRAVSRGWKEEGSSSVCRLVMISHWNPEENSTWKNWCSHQLFIRIQVCLMPPEKSPMAPCSQALAFPELSCSPASRILQTVNPPGIRETLCAGLGESADRAEAWRLGRSSGNTHLTLQCPLSHVWRGMRCTFASALLTCPQKTVNRPFTLSGFTEDDCKETDEARVTDDRRWNSRESKGTNQQQKWWQGGSLSRVSSRSPASSSVTPWGWMFQSFLCSALLQVLAVSFST